MYPIPANATRILYLESTGTQYIDTGLSLATGAFRFSAVAESGVACSLSGVLGVGSGTTQEKRWIVHFDDRTGGLIDRGTAAARANFTGVSLDTGKLTFSIELSSSKNIYVGRANGVATSYFSGRIVAAQIWDSTDTLVFDGIPVRVGAIGYLFDRVSGQFFGNSGTGAFVLGPDTFVTGVVPTRMMAMGVRKKPYDAEVEYIESTGTQYIDTGYILNTQSVITVSGKYTLVADYNNDNAQQQGVIKGNDTGNFRTVFANQGYSFTVFCGTRQIDTPSAKLPPVTFLADFPNRIVKVNSVQGSINQSDVTGTFTRPFFLFARCNASGGADTFSKFRLTSATFADGSTLVRDFVPCRVGQTGYLYDSANPTGGPLGNGLYGNAGTGNFTVGPDVT